LKIVPHLSKFIIKQWHTVSETQVRRVSRGPRAWTRQGHFSTSNNSKNNGTRYRCRPSYNGIL